jgi:hypothetical protein
MPIKLPKSKSVLLVGQVLRFIGKENKKTLKVRTISMVLDDYLKMVNDLDLQITGQGQGVSKNFTVRLLGTRSRSKK